MFKTSIILKHHVCSLTIKGNKDTDKLTKKIHSLHCI